MAGGTFDKTVGKVRPGTYVNFKAADKETIIAGTRGVVLIPLCNTNYGPAETVLTITAGAIDANAALLGYSVYDDDDAGNMLLIREAIKNAETVLVYITTEGTSYATGSGGGLTATAKYKGTRGNALTYTVSANPVDGYDVEVYLDGSKVEEYEGISSADDLSASNYITFTATDDEELSEAAGITLTGGEDAETSNSDVTAFLDAADGISFTTMCFPLTDSTLQAAVLTKIKYMRESEGKKRQAVVADMSSVDYEGIINVTNAYALEDVELTHAQATAYVAGATAGADYNESNTYKTVEGAIAVVDPKTHEEAVDAINNGEFFFSLNEAGDVIMEYDINSLVTYEDGKDETYRKNRVIRVLDTFHDYLVLNFPPNKFDNNDVGWDIMEGLGNAILKIFEDDNAITNVDYDSDFLVDREESTGDKTYFEVGIQPVDSAEKLFFTVTTR